MADLKIGRMTVGMYGTNCYLVYREGGEQVIIIDPPDAGAKIYDKVKALGFETFHILLTHGHFDHIMGTNELKECAGAKVYAMDSDPRVCEDTRLNVSAQIGHPYVVKADEYFHGDTTFTLGDVEIKVFATPGHTADSCCYYFEEAGFMVCGDTIFEESVGRTDLPTGSGSQLDKSVREKIFTLPDSTVLYPGHGDSTTVEHEKQYNPFF